MSDSAEFVRLKELIDKRALANELQLPPEPKLAEELNISRGRLRTLLRRLEEDGLIWRHVGKGTFIGQPPLSPSSPELFRDISIGNIMDARKLLEPQLAAQAAISALPADIIALERCLEDMRNASSYVSWKRLDERLHHLIAEATHNSLLLLLYDTLRQHGRAGLDVRLNEVLASKNAPSETDDQHAAIVKAIKAADPDAAEREMRRHLAGVRQLLFGIR